MVGFGTADSRSNCLEAISTLTVEAAEDRESGISAAFSALLTLGLAGSLVLAAASPAWPYHSFGRYNITVTPNTYVTAHYDVSRLPHSTVTFYLTDQKPLALAPSDSVEALMSQIAAATAAWNGIPTSSLRVSFAGFTPMPGDTAPTNPLGVVRFSSSIPPGAAAVGGARFQIPTGTSDFLPIFFSGVSLPTDLSRTSTSSSSFLPILVHEIGHGLGAKHSIVSSAMFQSRLMTRARLLTEDDVALISTLYPAPGFASSTGAISGRVTSAAGQGVSLAAVSALSDTLVIGAFTNPDGSYTIRGLPPGTYRLMAQPLMLGAVPSSAADNPGDPADLIDSRTLTGSVVSINTDIDSVFFGAAGATTKDLAAAATFVVRAGQTTTNVNVSVGNRGPLRLEVNTTFSLTSNGRSVPQIWVPRGGRVTAGSLGLALDAFGQNVSFTGPDIALVPGSVRTASSSSTIFKTAVNYSVQAGAGAALGSRSVIYTNGVDTYFSPGQVRVVASGPPQITGISPTAGRAGTEVIITGSDFADSAQVYFDGMLATVTSRSATRLAVVAPQGAGGRAAAVFVANPDGQGSEFLADPPRFTYDNVPQPSITILPASGQAGKTLTVTVTGANTNFRQGLTVLGFGSGDVVVNSVTVNSPTSLVASISILSPIDSRTFSVTALTGEEVAFLPDGFSIALTPPFALLAVSGNVQNGPPGSTLPELLVVQAEDSTGVPIRGVTVTFSVAFGGGSVSPATVATDANGRAATRLTLGGGINVVAATADQFAPTGFLAGGGDRSSLSIRYGVAGSGQRGLADAELPMPLTLTITDAAGSPLPGVPVFWLVTAGNGAVRPGATLTDSQGQVTAIWVLGPVAGVQTVIAGPPFFTPAPFTATAIAGGVQPAVPSNGIVNGAGFDSAVAALSPGAIASIFGANLSHAPPSGVQPGPVPGTDSLALVSNGTRVTFDGVPAPLFFVSPGQLNVQVPFELAGRSSALVVVILSGTASLPVPVSLLPASPALFTVNSSGKAAAVALNQDGVLNSAANGAARGSVIQLFATGLGAVTPGVATGRLAPGSPLPAVSREIPTVTVGGIPAVVEFSGLAPGFVGLWQVNARVPEGVAAGETPLLLRTGGLNANPVTIFVK